MKGKDEEQQPSVHVVVRDGFSQVITAWVQVFMVGVLIVSLFMTDYPAYQKERLQEEAARLTIAAERQVAIAEEQTRVAEEARAAAKAYEAQVLQAREDLDEFQVHTEDLEARVRELDAQRAQAFSSLAAIRADHQQLVQAADAAAWTIFVSQVTLLAAEGFRPRRLLWSVTEGQSLSYEEWLRGMIEVSDMAPWGAIQSAVSGVSRTSLGPVIADVADLGEFESRAFSLLESHQSYFACQSIDKDSWAMKAEEYLAKKSELVSQCIEDSWQTRAAAEGWSSARLSRLRQGRFEDGGCQDTCRLFHVQAA